MIEAVTFCINFHRLNIKILEVSEIPLKDQEDRIDTQMKLQLLSSDLAEVYKLGYYAAKEKLSFTL